MISEFYITAGILKCPGATIPPKIAVINVGAIPDGLNIAELDEWYTEVSGEVKAYENIDDMFAGPLEQYLGKYPAEQHHRLNDLIETIKDNGEFYRHLNRKCCFWITKNHNQKFDDYVKVDDEREIAVWLKEFFPEEM